MDHTLEPELPFSRRPLSQAISSMLEHMATLPTPADVKENAAPDNKGVSLKTVMVAQLRALSQQLVTAAVERSYLPPDHPDHLSAGDMNQLNATMRGFGAAIKKAIEGADNIHDLCGQLQRVADNALSYDEEDGIVDPSESLLYPILTGVIEAGIAHLDPEDKRLQVHSTKGQRVVSLKGRSLEAKCAAELEQVLQRYEDTFEQQANEIDSLDRLEVGDIAPVHFAKRGVVSDDEMRQCVNAALKETYCTWRDVTNEQEQSEEEKEQIHIRNRSVYDIVSADYAKEGDDSPEARFYDMCDGMIERDFFSPFRGAEIEFNSRWGRHMNDALARRVMQNRKLRVVGAPLEPRMEGPYESPQYQRDVEGLLENCEHTRDYLASSHEVLRACDAVVCEHYGDTASPHAMAAQAAHEGVDLDMIDDHAYTLLCGRVTHIIDNYMQTHFYDRVNAMRLRDEEGLIHLEHDRDNEGGVISMPLHSTALVHKAYALAEEAVPEKLKGTRLYDRALHKAQDYFLAELAQSGLWTCDYQSDYKDANQLLMIAREDYSKRSPAR